MAKTTKYSKEFIDALGEAVDEVSQKMPKGSRGRWSAVLALLYGKGFKEETRISSNDSIRSLYRFHYEDARNRHRINNASLIDRLSGLNYLEDRILKRIKKKTLVSALAELLEVTEDDILLTATKLKLSGHTNIKVFKEGNRTFIQLIKRFKRLDNEFDKTELWHGEKEITIGVVSDTHCGSEYHAKEELDKMYDIFEDRGITMVLHAGDLSEGMKKLRMETFLGNVAIGFNAQLDYVVRNYPRRKGITTYAINGNHDLWYLTEGLANFVNTVALVRDDIKYMGDDFARIFITPKIDITMFHPNDGSASNVFTKLQNFGDRGGNKLSKINIIGHYHKLGWIYYRDMHILYPGSFQKQSEWMNMNNLRSEVAGIILKMKIKDDGSLKELIIEHVMDFE